MTENIFIIFWITGLAIAAILVPLLVLEKSTICPFCNETIPLEEDVRFSVCEHCGRLIDLSELE